MNERIQELADQCEGRTICECGEVGFNLEKFAKLIMKDVCNKLEPVLAKEILQLYGIEE